MANNAVNVGAIPPTVMQMMIRGLETDESCMAEQICTVNTRPTTLEGSIPLMLSDYTIGAGQNRRLGALEPATVRGGGFGSLSYDARAYVGASFISDKERADLKFYSIDALAEKVMQARVDANLGIDLDLADLLSNTTVNTEYDVTVAGTGAWDTTPSTPLNDMQEIMRLYAPDADTMVIGRLPFNALIRNEDFLATTHHYAAAGQIPQSDLFNMIAARIPQLQHFHLLDKKYNAGGLDATSNDPPGATGVQFARVFESGVWFGKKEALQMIIPNVPEVQNRTGVKRKEEIRAHEVFHNRYVDLKRALKEHGCAVTNVIT